MKKTVLKISLACLALAVMSNVALAQPANLLGNPGFEQPGVAKTTNGFSSLGGPDGSWADDGVNYTNTGVENAGVHSGAWRAFEMSFDDGAYQIADPPAFPPFNPLYTMTLNDQITLTWWAIATVDPSTGNTNPPQQVVGFIRAATPLDAFSTTTKIGTPTVTGLSGAWTQYTMNYTATPADVNSYIGVYFNTTNAFGRVTNSFAGYDDFYLAVLPAGSKPQITIQPVSQTAFSGGTATFNVGAVAATGYQWMAGAQGSAINTFTNLPNAGQFSGATTTSLTITNLTPTNNGDYVVVVSNGSGSVTSSVANLTVATIIYQETFSSNNASQVIKNLNQSVTNVGWINELVGTFGNDSRMFSNGGVPYPRLAVYTYLNNGQSNCNAAYYFTTATANGGPYDVSNGDGAGPVSGRMAFPGINLATVANLSFAVSCNNGPGATEQAHWAVQINNGQWYVSTNYFTQTGATFQNFSFIFTNRASAWNQLTVSGHDVLQLATNVVVGPIAGADLSGYITGAGFVFEYTTGGNIQFDNYYVLGATPPSLLPSINSPPTTRTNITGSTASFSVSATTNGVTAGLTYQWLSSPVGLGTFTPLSTTTQIPAVTNATLVISNVVNGINDKDYEVIVTDGFGSVTSAPPATLWISHSAPIIVNDTTIYPDTFPSLGGNAWSIHAGNNNIMNVTATFTGDLPITYQWQYTADTNVAPSNISNATNNTYTLSNITTTNANGYYRVNASNLQGGPVSSSWAQLTVLPSATAQVHWSAKVPFTGLTAAQILGGTPGTPLECESFGGVSITVTNGTNLFVFDTTGASVTKAGGYTIWGPTPPQYNGTTLDTNFDTVLNNDQEGVNVMTVNNLIVSNLYSVQLFGFGDNEAPGRVGNFNTTNDTADVSQSFAMGDNVYVVGTFTATNTTQQVNLTGGSTYMCCAIVRNVPATPTLSIQKSGSNLQVNYTNGILLLSTNLTIPLTNWVTITNPSPYIFTPATNGVKMFFRARTP